MKSKWSVYLCVGLKRRSKKERDDGTKRPEIAIEPCFVVAAGEKGALIQFMTTHAEIVAEVGADALDLRFKELC